MIKDDEGSSGSGSEPTKIDLGDDLIEKTAIIPGQATSENLTPAESQPAPAPAELIQNARILLGEGFSEEAKKVLRQVVLLGDGIPQHEEAKALLEQIHEAELRQMFVSNEPSARKSFASSYDESILDADADEITRLLDRDLKLGEHSKAELSFFSDERLLAQFADKVDRELGESPRDRTDLAIGFIEMGLYSVAIRLLQSLIVADNDDQRLNASALAAYAHILNGEPYRAISVLQPVLNDGEIDKSRKTECFYLMGRAEQAAGSVASAMGWYFQVQANETDYRDVTQRIARCRSALKGK